LLFLENISLSCPGGTGLHFPKKSYLADLTLKLFRGLKKLGINARGISGKRILLKPNLIETNLDPSRVPARDHVKRVHPNPDSLSPRLSERRFIDPETLPSRICRFSWQNEQMTVTL
jgi:hypothetical protein